MGRFAHGVSSDLSLLVSGVFGLEAEGSRSVRSVALRSCLEFRGLKSGPVCFIDPLLARVGRWSPRAGGGSQDGFSPREVLVSYCQDMTVIQELPVEGLHGPSQVVLYQ